MRDSASSMGIGSPRRLPLPTKKPTFELVVQRLAGAEARSFRLGVLDLTLRTRTSVPLTTMEDARPWYPTGTCL